MKAWEKIGVHDNGHDIIIRSLICINFALMLKSKEKQAIKQEVKVRKFMLPYVST